MQWHALEETEHKAVAFDVFNVATAGWSNLKRYVTRVQAMVITTFQFTMNITSYAAQLLQADGMGRARAYAAVLWFLFGKPGFFRNGLKVTGAGTSPASTPGSTITPALLESWQARFKEASKSKKQL